MAAITIDDTARFVSILSFSLGSGDSSAISHEVQNAVEKRIPSERGFIGSIVMLNAEKTHLLAVSIWQSAGAWGAAQYDDEIGRIVTDAVETAKSYEIATYETISFVRGRSDQLPSSQS